MRFNFKTNLFLLLAVLIFGISVFSFVVFQKGAFALNPADYTKISNSSLLIGDWNRLDSDFIARSGDLVGGDINMNNNSIIDLPLPSSTDTSFIASVGYVNNLTDFAARDKDGNPQNMVCGTSPLTTTAWEYYAADGIYTDVYTTNDGTSTGSPNFTSPPLYIVSILGNNVDYLTGANAVYIPKASWPGYQPGDEFKYFRLYLRTSVTEAEAETRDWYVNWCGIGI